MDPHYGTQGEDIFCPPHRDLPSIPKCDRKLPDLKLEGIISGKLCFNYMQIKNKGLVGNPSSC